MATITCARCSQQAEALPALPLAGATGAAVQAHTCPSCWAEWQQAAPSFINHHGLHVVEPAGRARLYELMREFLSIPAEA
jgi:Fe-S cluster biosynthesis and repair protein YggX